VDFVGSRDERIINLFTGECGRFKEKERMLLRKLGGFFGADFAVSHKICFVADERVNRSDGCEVGAIVVPGAYV
jgi:hypothetical protein